MPPFFSADAKHPVRHKFLILGGEVPFIDGRNREVIPEGMLKVLPQCVGKASK